MQPATVRGAGKAPSISLSHGLTRTKAHRARPDPPPSSLVAAAPGHGVLVELAVTGLSQADAHALLDSVLPGNLDPKVRDQIVAETRGNPLALLELARGLTPAALAIELELPGAVPLEGTIEASFRRRLAALPDETRQLVLIAAADPTGDTTLVWRAAGLPGHRPRSGRPCN